jgi:KDO2-lipid IV(A) lauroyltransferase
VRQKDLRRSLALLVARPFFALAVVAGRLLPPRWLLALARACSGAVYILFPGTRANLLSNAGRILGEQSVRAERARLAKEVLASFSRFIMEWVAPRSIGSPQAIFERTRGKGHFEAAVEAGRGVIGLTLHMGNYELPSRELAALGRRVSVVFSRERIGFLEELRSRARLARALEEIAIDDSPFFAIEVLARLRRGEIVLIAGDQVGAAASERFPFLHGEAPFSLWPARLSQASGAPILPAFCLHGPEGYRLEIEPPIFPPPERSAREITAEVVKVLERYVKAYPGQWLMVHDFWGA